VAAHAPTCASGDHSRWDIDTRQPPGSSIGSDQPSLVAFPLLLLLLLLLRRRFVVSVVVAAVSGAGGEASKAREARRDGSWTAR